MAILLFRASLDEEDELTVAQSLWDGWVFTNRMSLALIEYKAPPRLVIGRYSVLPFYKELEEDLKIAGCRLANSYSQHLWIANLDAWYQDLKQWTFPTFFGEWDRVPEGAYVLKGKTNSMKHKWRTHMFAATKSEIPTIFGRLLDDTFLGTQGIVARQYVPLKQLGVGINGMPFTHEYRLFYWGNQFIAGGFYWSSYGEDDKPTQLHPQARKLGDEIAQIASKHAQFFVLDIAETAMGDWVLVEVNDGQMSGLSDIDPQEFYSKLGQIVGE